MTGILKRTKSMVLIRTRNHISVVESVQEPYCNFWMSPWNRSTVSSELKIPVLEWVQDCDVCVFVKGHAWNWWWLMMVVAHHRVQEPNVWLGPGTKGPGCWKGPGTISRLLTGSRNHKFGWVPYRKVSRFLNRSSVSTCLVILWVWEKVVKNVLDEVF